MAKTSVVFGIYRQEAQAAGTIDALREAGFRSTDISILMPASPGDQGLTVEKDTKAPEGAVAGASAGALLGGALGWMAAAGTLAIPGLGPFLAAGPLMSVLGGVGVGGTVGGLAGALIGAGTPEYVAKQYERGFRDGHVLLSVQCDDSQWRTAALEILKRTGAEDISSTRESSGEGRIPDDLHTRKDVASNYEAEFRKNFGINHTDLGMTYAEAAPLYEFGFRMARSKPFAGKNFEDVEPELKAACLEEFHGEFPEEFQGGFSEDNWEQASSLVLFGWERAGGAIRQGFALI
jgi:hypothetical protein